MSLKYIDSSGNENTIAGVPEYTVATGTSDGLMSSTDKTFIDSFNSLTWTTATLNSTYANGGYVSYVQLGKLVLVKISDLKMAQNITAGSYVTFATGLPSPAEAAVFIISTPYSNIDMRVKMQDGCLKEHWGGDNITAGLEFSGSMIYLAQ